MECLPAANRKKHPQLTLHSIPIQSVSHSFPTLNSTLQNFHFIEKEKHNRPLKTGIESNEMKSGGAWNGKDLLLLHYSCRGEEREETRKRSGPKGRNTSRQVHCTVFVLHSYWSSCFVSRLLHIFFCALIYSFSTVCSKRKR